MGEIIGGIIGGVGQAAAASAQADAAKHAADLSMTGYNYLTKGAGAAPTQAYIDAGKTALQGQGTTQNAIAQLLGVAPRAPLYGGTSPAPQAAAQAAAPVHVNNPASPSPQAGGGATAGQYEVSTIHVPGGGSSGGGSDKQVVNIPAQQQQAAAPPAAGATGTPAPAGATGAPTDPAAAGAATAQQPGVSAPDAFQGYQGSTGYQFQLGQGLNAINSNAAAKGLMGSGGTAKALEQYGQNLASTTFNNYLTQLSGLNSIQGGTAQMGQNSLGQVATVGTAAGGGAANAVIQGGNAVAGGITGIANSIGNAVGGAINTVGGWNPSPSTSQFPGGGSVNYLGGLY